MKGYEDEPYLRFLPSRVVEVNTRAPSKYANEDRYALRPVPAQANSDATPKWQPVSRDGSYRWFDHRIHLMEKGKPPQVKDESKRTKIFDWDVPMTVGGRAGQGGRHARVGAGNPRPAASPPCWLALVALRPAVLIAGRRGSCSTPAPAPRGHAAAGGSLAGETKRGEALVRSLRRRSLCALVAARGRR